MEDTRTKRDRKAYQRAWRAANRERVKEYERLQYERHPEYRQYRRDCVAKRYAERRAFIDEWKLSHGCLDCGYAEHACALDLDHRDPSSKLYKVAEIMHATWDRLLAEVEKCDVRCRNCHAVRTQGQRLGGRPPTKGGDLNGS